MLKKKNTRVECNVKQFPETAPAIKYAIQKKKIITTATAPVRCQDKSGYPFIPLGLTPKGFHKTMDDTST